METKYRYCLIITHGRTGSTLLKGLLNTSPDCLIKGENNNFFYYQWLAHDAITRAQAFSPIWSGPTGSWFGIEEFSPDRNFKELRRLANRVLLSGNRKRNLKVIGFKEIRYFGDNNGFTMPKDHLAEYIGFLSELFSPVTFIHLTRDLNDVARSSWFRNPCWQKRLHELSEFNHHIKSILYQFNHLSVDYNDLTSPNPDRIAELFTKLGIEYNRARLMEERQVFHGGARPS